MSTDRMAASLQHAASAFDYVARAMREYEDSVLAMFTRAEIQEAKASGIPLLDYWAFWESRGYTSPRWKA